MCDVSCKDMLLKILELAGMDLDDVILWQSCGCKLVGRVGNAAVQKLNSVENIEFPEDFVWNIATSRNELLLTMMTGRQKLEGMKLLSEEELDLYNNRFRRILETLCNSGAKTGLKTPESTKIDEGSSAWLGRPGEKNQAKLMKSWATQEKIQAMYEFQQWSKKSDDAMQDISTISNPYSCLEELRMHLDLFETISD